MSIFASSSHMEGASKLRCDFQNFVERAARKRVMERFVDVVEGHAVRQAFEDDLHRQTGATNSELTTQQFRVRHNPLVVLIGPRLPSRHSRSTSSLNKMTALKPGI